MFGFQRSRQDRVLFNCDPETENYLLGEELMSADGIVEPDGAVINDCKIL